MVGECSYILYFPFRFDKATLFSSFEFGRNCRKLYFRISTIIRCIRLSQLVIETLVQELVLLLGAEDSDAFLSHGHHSLINFQLGNCGVLAVLDCLVGSKEQPGPAGAIAAVNQERSSRHCGREEWFI